MHIKVHGHGAPFRILVRTYPHGTIPDNSPPLQPLPERNTVTYQVLWHDGAARVWNGRLAPDVAPNPPVSPEFGAFVVNDNDFTTGRAILKIGDYELISNIDFIPGGNAGLTALAISNAINLLTGYESIAFGPVVLMAYDAGSSDIVEFRAVHLGTILNFTPFMPDNGEMFPGFPAVEAPLLG